MASLIKIATSHDSDFVNKIQPTKLTRTLSPQLLRPAWGSSGQPHLNWSSPIVLHLAGKYMGLEPSCAFLHCSIDASSLQVLRNHTL
jgi:hypothetical protein